MSLKISVRNYCGRSLEGSGSIRTDVAFHSPHRTTEIPSKKFDWMYRAWVYSVGFASRVEWCFSGRTHNLIIWWFTTQASDDVLLDHKLRPDKHRFLLARCEKVLIRWNVQAWGNLWKAGERKKTWRVESESWNEPTGILKYSLASFISVTFD